MNQQTSSPREGTSAFERGITAYIITLAVIVAALLVINHVFLINARIPSSSMENTIMIGDRVIGNRLAYTSHDPERYDIVIFRYPDDRRTYFIKRIIGLPGETVRIKDGKVYIDDSSTPLDDSFCPETPTGDFGPYTVPAGHYFMLGDNRNHSNDSRYWVHSFVPRDDILAKAAVRYWPFTKAGPVG